MEGPDTKTTYAALRAEWPVFHYHDFAWHETDEGVVVTYHFEIPGLAEFEPSLVLPSALNRRDFVNRLETPLGKRILFSLGMTELVSYWKSACPPTVKVHAGWLDDWEIDWWKKLYFHGLGEFFHINGIAADIRTFMVIQNGRSASDEKRADALRAREDPFELTGGRLVPVGGGKDSVVSLELLSGFRDNNVPFMINPGQAGRETARIAGYPDERTLSVTRTLDPRLLELNSRGYLNGHTPYSAIVAFVSYLTAYLFGLPHIVLSNEASANEGNLAGGDVNHQYSKSFRFEEDFRSYAAHTLSDRIVYFSLMRPFNELQIAKRFAAAPAYFDVFRSCNVGSRENRWCGHCPKCLFVRLILAPFVEPDKLDGLFGSDLLDDPEMAADFDGLTGLSPIKPFECVGVAEEVRCAVEWAIKQCEDANRPLPLLFRHYRDVVSKIFEPMPKAALLTYFNEEHGIPDIYMKPIRDMRAYVAGNP